MPRWLKVIAILAGLVLASMSLIDIVRGSDSILKDIGFIALGLGMPIWIIIQSMGSKSANENPT